MELLECPYMILSQEVTVPHGWVEPPLSHQWCPYAAHLAQIRPNDPEGLDTYVVHNCACRMGGTGHEDHSGYEYQYPEYWHSQNEDLWCVENFGEIVRTPYRATEYLLAHETESGVVYISNQHGETFYHAPSLEMLTDAIYYSPWQPINQPLSPDSQSFVKLHWGDWIDCRFLYGGRHVTQARLITGATNTAIEMTFWRWSEPNSVGERTREEIPGGFVFPSTMGGLSVPIVVHIPGIYADGFRLRVRLEDEGNIASQYGIEGFDLLSTATTQVAEGEPDPPQDPDPPDPPSPHATRPIWAQTTGHLGQTIHHTPLIGM